MKAKHADINISKANPFENCKLQRKPYADVLTDIVQNYAEGFVLAINNEWGTGKTTFVKMWQQQLENDNFKTLYFNAWENDFDSKPLVAIMSEFKSLSTTETKVNFDTLLKKGAAISKAAIPSLVKALAGIYIDTKSVTDAIKDATKASVDILSEEIEQHSKKKESLSAFRKELTNYISKATNEKPLVFIIDELDRCRPNYAVEVLEQIKHLFSVKGVVFVLSIDKEQLGHAVRGVYGSDKINADEYLRRFIDIEYSIPEPKTELFCEYLYDYFGFGEFVQHPIRKSNFDILEEKREYLSAFVFLFKQHNISLRVQEKIFSHLRLVMASLDIKHNTFPSLYATLVFILHTNNILFFRIKRKEIEIQELFDLLLEDFIGEVEVSHDNIIMIKVLSFFMIFYSNYYYNPNPNKLYNDDLSKDNMLELRSHSKFFNISNKVINGIHTYRNNHSFYYVSIAELLNKIELLVPLIK